MLFKCSIRRISISYTLLLLLQYFVVLIFFLNAAPLHALSFANDSTSISSIEEESNQIMLLLNNGNVKVAIKKAEKLRAIVKDLDDDKLLWRVTSQLFESYCRDHQSVKAIDLMMEAKAKAEKKKRYRRLCVINVNLGIAYAHLGENEKASSYLLDCMSYLDEEESEGNNSAIFHEMRAGVFSNLANVLKEVDQERSLEYFEQAIRHAKLAGHQLQIATFYYNLGFYYWDLKNKEAAITYLDSSKTLHQLVDNPIGVMKCDMALGDIAEDYGTDEVALMRYKTAYQLIFKDSIAGWSNKKSYSHTLHNTILPFSISKLYLKMDSLPQALRYANEAFELAQNMNNAKDQQQNQMLLADIHQAAGDFEKSNELLRGHIALSDSINIAQINKEALINQQKYAVAKKENDIQNLKKESHNRKIANWMMLGISGLLLISLVLLYNRSQLRKALHQAKAAKQAEILTIKEQSLTNMALLGHSKTQLIHQLKNDLHTIVNKDTNALNINKLLHQIESKVSKQNDWETFQQHFETIHPMFFKKLNSTNGDLTGLDLKHCAFIKLNLSNKEAAHLMAISPKSVQMARYRLKKKLSLGAEDNLQTWIRSI